MELEWDGVGSSYPSTSTGDPTSQAGAKLEVERETRRTAPSRIV